MASTGTSNLAFSLPDPQGVLHEPGGPATVVYFTSNRCPHALRWQARMARAARDYTERGVRFLAVNVPCQFPATSEILARMGRDDLETVHELSALDHWRGVAYLYDEDLSLAQTYEAMTTPDVFVLDSDLRIRYRGAPDGQWDDEAADAQWVRDALDAVLAGEAPQRPQTNSVGCPIKWRRPAQS
jgi:AhpC/TSA family